jgi:hypothetical protein
VRDEERTGEQRPAAVPDANGRPELAAGAPPRAAPHGSVWPASLALGTILALLGVATTPVFIVAGLLLIAVSLAGWLGEILHE